MDGSGSRLAALAEQIHTVLDEAYPGVLPPHAPPATDAEIQAVSDAFGFPLPTELAELYAIAREGYIGALEATAIDQLHVHTVTLLDHYEGITVEGPPADHWEGELPQGDLIAFASNESVIVFYEASGPLAGRVVLYDFDAYGEGVWGRMARSLEDCFTWQLAAAQLGGFEALTFGTDRPVINPIGISRNEGPFLQFIDQARPAIQAAGGTSAYFDVYDPPPGTRTPAR